jgi:dTDP-4-amino-4,6-dideoxygalactose transaminase
MRTIANHGMETQYQYDMVGVNSRLDSIQAAILNVKLQHLDEYSAARRSVANFYDKAFAGNPNIEIPARNPKSTHVFHQYTIRLRSNSAPQSIREARNRLHRFLKEKDIPTMIYYPVPLHLQKAYNGGRYNKGDFPVAETLCDCVLSLPMHTELSEEQLRYIVSMIFC